MGLEGNEMKRRNLLIRTAVGTVSTGVFTAVGWLMGTRTLGMAGTWTTLDQVTCPDGQFDCGCLESSETQCNWTVSGCGGTGPGCATWEWERYHCCLAVSQYCETRYRIYLCGSCPQPCTNQP